MGAAASLRERGIIANPTLLAKAAWVFGQHHITGGCR
jgi:hypothetical protein